MGHVPACPSRAHSLTSFNPERQRGGASRLRGAEQPERGQDAGKPAVYEDRAHIGEIDSLTGCRIPQMRDPGRPLACRFSVAATGLPLIYVVRFAAPEERHE